MRLPRLGNIFYGWWVVVAGTLIMTLHSGVYFFGFGAFFTPLIDEFGWGRAALSGAFSLSKLEGGFLSPVAGVIVDRWGARVLFMGSFGMMGLGFILLSRVDSILTFYLVYGICFGLGGGFGMGVIVSSSVNNWFARRRSLALGIAHSGVGAGGFGASLLAWLIVQVGWRQAAVVAGIAVMTLGIPLSMLVRHKPEKYGLLRDGDLPSDTATGREADHASKGRGRHASPDDGNEIDYTAGQALRSGAFWLLTTSFNLRQFVTSAMAAHLIPYLVGAGYSLTTAATLLGFMAASSTIGRLGSGWVGDRMDKRYAMAGCLGLLCVGVIGSLVTHSLWAVGVAMFLYGVAYGGTTPLGPSLIGEYFGRKSFATILGLTYSAALVGTIGGPLVTGYIFDVTGSYTWAFGLFIAICLAAVASVLTLRHATHRPPIPAPA